MSVTATRLGKSPLTLDWSYLPNHSLKPEPSQLSASWNTLKGKFETGEVGFFHCPTDPKISQIEECRELSKRLEGKFKHCLFLGIGGSSLGPASLLDALAHERTQSIDFVFIDNPDPITWKIKLQTLNPNETLVCCVSKSGKTFETLAQFLLVLEWLGEKRWKSNLIVITDPQEGELRAWAQACNVPSLSIPKNIGGRFSIFTSVGLFPALIAGVDVAAFQQGAREVKDFVEKTDVSKNPLFILSDYAIQTYKNHPIHVLMPYSTALKTIGGWWAQLWGESLGKGQKGFTPVAAVGATDQHSLLQLFQEGPNDKLLTFITVNETRDNVSLPALSPSHLTGNFPTLKLLGKCSLGELLTLEYRATLLSLARKSRPMVTWQLDRLDARALGALYFALAVQTAFCGIHWKVNPFDQPGVEDVKNTIRDSLTQRKTDQQNLADAIERSPLTRLRPAVPD